ncbi:glutamate--cysteine ligase [Formosimonas limnophila]|uniref:Glutamate--cysteine ligase n=1 Tax=Formosimonas limnophila TaxID=1384487 RepID=A0A8J3FZZ0_9BURK|nr:glutamate--cysteine ligase [Formosimonas limnophila]GHA78539.1 glutamate--cysteine ligase [Formosimonas limnophila]
MVPHLRTALTGPLSELETKMLGATPMIERWFRMEWQEHTPPFYSSVDLRNAGFKLAPVDTNLYPGGFNNLAEEMFPLATQAALAAVEKYCPDARNLLIIPEKHTRNPFYLQNVAQLSKIMRLTGLNVRLGSLDDTITQPTPITLPNGETLMLEPLERNGRRITLDHGTFDPCTILLNNDLSGGQPTILENIKEQTLLPPLHAGWTVRRKSTHFSAYDEVTKKFAKALDIDPWLINPIHTQISGVDFNTQTGEDALATAVETTLKKIAKKYKEYGITEKPFLIVKADAGTYGMGIMTVRSADDVKELNRKQRNKMAVVKEGLEVHDLLIQEGVPTIETWGGNTAEPVVYMIDRYVVGGFYRVNSERGVDENLNSAGMHFETLSFVKESERRADDLGLLHNRFYSYGVVGRLAMLAASLELEKTDPYQEMYA